MARPDYGLNYFSCNQKIQKGNLPLYINSPSGSVTSTLAIVDTMKFIKREVSTFCVGIAASGAALVLSLNKRQKIYSKKCRGYDSSANWWSRANDDYYAITAKHILKTQEKT